MSKKKEKTADKESFTRTDLYGFILFFGFMGLYSVLGAYTLTQIQLMFHLFEFRLFDFTKSVDHFYIRHTVALLILLWGLLIYSTFKLLNSKKIRELRKKNKILVKCAICGLEFKTDHEMEILCDNCKEEFDAQKHSHFEKMSKKQLRAEGIEFEIDAKIINAFAKALMSGKEQKKEQKKGILSGQIINAFAKVEQYITSNSIIRIPERAKQKIYEIVDILEKEEAARPSLTLRKLLVDPVGIESKAKHEEMFEEDH